MGWEIDFWFLGNRLGAIQRRGAENAEEDAEKTVGFVSKCTEELGRTGIDVLSTSILGATKRTGKRDRRQ
jgi:hypothetical protein